MNEEPYRGIELDCSGEPFGFYVCLHEASRFKYLVSSRGLHCLTDEQAHAYIAALQKWLEMPQWWKDSVDKELHDHYNVVALPNSSGETKIHGHVYVMKDARNGRYKIGFSKSPLKREKTLQSEVPEVSLLHSWPGSMKDESHLHEVFRKKHARGEWFNLDESDIHEINTYFTTVSGNA